VTVKNINLVDMIVLVSGYGYRPHVSGEFNSESGKNPLSKVEKNISATNTITFERVNPDMILIR